MTATDTAGTNYATTMASASALAASDVTAAPPMPDVAAAPLCCHHPVDRTHRVTSLTTCCSAAFVARRPVPSTPMRRQATSSCKNIPGLVARDAHALAASNVP